MGQMFGGLQTLERSRSSVCVLVFKKEQDNMNSDVLGNLIEHYLSLSEKIDDLAAQQEEILQKVASTCPIPTGTDVTSPKRKGIVMRITSKRPLVRPTGIEWSFRAIQVRKDGGLSERGEVNLSRYDKWTLPEGKPLYE